MVAMGRTDSSSAVFFDGIHISHLLEVLWTFVFLKNDHVALPYVFTYLKQYTGQAAPKYKKEENKIIKSNISRGNKT
jgi:hypothetical protein